MAKDKDDKKSDDKDAKKGEAKAELSPEEAAAKSKKKKLLLLVVGGVVATAGIGGGLAFFLAKGGDKMAAKSPQDEHGAGAQGDATAEGHAKADAKDGHGEAKADGHGDAKADAHADAKADGHGDAKKADAKADPKLAKLDGVDFGCTYPLQPFHLNLGNPLENRYVRLEVAVEYGCAEEIKAEMEKRLPQLRDAIITVTSRKTREFLLGPDGKEQLRKEIQTQINYHMAHKIDDVYLTDILIE